MQYLKEYKKDIVFVIVVIILFFIFSNNVAILHIKGDSMYPTYEDGNILFLKKDKSISNKIWCGWFLRTGHEKSFNAETRR